MLLTVILTAIVLVSTNVALYFVVKRRLNDGFRSFFAPRGEQLSEFAELVGVITDQAASKNAQSLKAVFMGQNSVVSKNSARLETAIETDLVTQQAPLLGMGINMFPQLQKLVTKNPGALQMLASFMKGQGQKDQLGGDNQLIQTADDNGQKQTQDVFKY